MDDLHHLKRVNSGDIGRPPSAEGVLALKRRRRRLGASLRRPASSIQLFLPKSAPSFTEVPVVLSAVPTVLSSDMGSVVKLLGTAQEAILQGEREQRQKLIEMSTEIKQLKDRLTKETSDLKQTLSKTISEKTEAEQNLSDLCVKEKKLRQEFATMKAEHDRAQALMRESHQTNVVEEVRKAVDDEKQKTLCQICFTSPRNTITLPCLHLLNCFKCLEEYRKQKNVCPTCRTPINGILRCDISLD